MKTSKLRDIALIFAALTIIGGVGYMVYGPGTAPEVPTIQLNMSDITTPGSTTTTTPSVTVTPDSGSDTKTPTSLALNLGDTAVDMGSYVWSEVVSNGQNHPVTIHLTHIGLDRTETLEGLLGPDGQFNYGQELHIPGNYEVWATAGEAESNHVILTVRGVMIACTQRLYAKALHDEAQFQVISHLSGSCTIHSSLNGDWATSQSHYETVTLDEGYAAFTHGFDHYALGDYQMDARILGETALSYEDPSEDIYATCWLEVTR